MTIASSIIFIRNLLMRQIQALHDDVSPLPHETVLCTQINKEEKEAHTASKVFLYKKAHQLIVAIRAQNFNEALMRFRNINREVFEHTLVSEFDEMMGRLRCILIDKVSAQFEHYYQANPTITQLIYTQCLASFLMYSYGVGRGGYTHGQLKDDDYLVKIFNQLPLNMKSTDMVNVLETAYHSSFEIFRAHINNINVAYDTESSFLKAYLEFCKLHHIMSPYFKKCLYDAVLDSTRVCGSIDYDEESYFLEDFQDIYFINALAEYFQYVEKNLLKAIAMMTAYDVVTLREVEGEDAQITLREFERIRNEVDLYSERRMVHVYIKINNLLKKYSIVYRELAVIYDTDTAFGESEDMREKKSWLVASSQKMARPVYLAAKCSNSTGENKLPENWTPTHFQHKSQAKSVEPPLQNVTNTSSRRSLKQSQ